MRVARAVRAVRLALRRRERAPVDGLRVRDRRRKQLHQSWDRDGVRQREWDCDGRCCWQEESEERHESGYGEAGIWRGERLGG